MSDMFKVEEHIPAAEEHLEAEAHPHLPAPSIWPITMAFGITMLGLGVLTNLVFILFGIVVIALGAYGWAGELRRE